MALTGLQIQKLLPKTNCKECGCNTCLAFAMKLAAKRADLAECPYASDEAKKVLGAAAEAPVRGVGLGPDRALKLGEETVLYRHERTFVHQTAIAVNVNDADSPEQVEATLKAINDYLLIRVGQEIRIDAVGVTQTGPAASAFVALAKKAWEATRRPLILRSPSVEALTAAAAATADCHGVLCCPDAASADALLPVAREHGFALAVTADDLDALATLAGRLRDGGFNDLLLRFRTHSLAEQFQTNTIARRAAVKGSFKPTGFPSLRFIESADPLDATAEAATEIAKYGGLVVLPRFDAALLATLMTLRMNVYTDPQKPIQVEPKLYPIGEPSADSPVFVTTNFSLTYFIVSGEIENSGTSAWLLVPECEGMSVLTAWAAGKFSAASIAKFAKEVALEEQVTGRRIVIPGYVAQISGELEDAMAGWEVLVGPPEAADLESFVKARLN